MKKENNILIRRLTNCGLSLVFLMGCLWGYYYPRMMLSEKEKLEKITEFIRDDRKEKASDFIDRAYNKDEAKEKKIIYNL